MNGRRERRCPDERIDDEKNDLTDKERRSGKQTQLHTVPLSLLTWFAWGITAPFDTSSEVEIHSYGYLIDFYYVIHMAQN